ncbi:MAG: hypothetical protein P8Y58_11135 [Novosphingobium sp.]
MFGQLQFEGTTMRRRAGIGSAILAIALMGSAPPAQLRYRIDPKASGVNAQVAFFGLARKTASFPAIMGRLSFPDTPGTITASPIALDVTLDARMLQADDALTLEHAEHRPLHRLLVERVEVARRLPAHLGERRGLRANNRDPGGHRGHAADPADRDNADRPPRLWHDRMVNRGWP